MSPTSKVFEGNAGLRERVFANIEKSRLARESSNYSDFAKFEKKFAVEGIGKAKNHDYRVWKDCPVSGEYKLTQSGLRIAKVRDLKNVKSYMRDNAIEFIIDRKGKILPDYAAGGFKKLGKEKYLEQTVLIY